VFSLLIQKFKLLKGDFGHEMKRSETVRHAWMLADSAKKRQ
jgi:hypothetical protein